MAIIEKGDLQYKYSWTAIPSDDPRVTGAADQVFLSGHEGYEVLPFLNNISKTKETALKAELLIQTKLPGDVRSRVNILKWLQENWS